MATLLGFDVGTRKIGVAVGQTITRTASPLITIYHQQQRPHWAAIAQIVREWQPAAAVLGLPYHMDDRLAAWAEQVQRFARQLHGRFDLPVHLVDERLTTRAARQQLGQASAATGIDAVAAQLILETWLNDQHD